MEDPGGGRVERLLAEGEGRRQDVVGGVGEAAQEGDVGVEGTDGL